MNDETLANPLFERVATILEEVRGSVVRSVNHHMVVAYWLIGREIVVEEQGGKERAAYGKQILAELSKKLTQQFGRGFSATNLRYFREFYQAFEDRFEIRHPSRDELGASNEEGDDQSATRFITQRVTNSGSGLNPNLSWTHYRTLLRVENRNARDFYESEAATSRWSVRQLERQIHSMTYERLLKSRDKEAMLNEARAKADLRPLDVLKDPYVLEFLDLPESHRLTETDLEQALIGKLHDFLLELGTGFAFVGRQQRLTLDGDHFYPDLVFYHIRLKCYVVIDLKTGKLTHEDLGQMQMYVHYHDREVTDDTDNPTIGLLLCAEKNDAMVKYVLDEKNEQIFASRYRLELPDEEQLLAELRKEMQRIQGD